MLVVSSAVVVLACLLNSPDDDRVVTPNGWKIPELCMVRAWTGYTCPGCGLTRSFIHFFRGEWAASTRMHPVGWLMAAAVLSQFPYRLFALRRLNAGGDPAAPGWAVWFGRVLIASLIGSWAFRMIRDGM